MKILKYFLLLLFLSYAFLSLGQSSKAAQYFGDPIVVDSSSTMIIPIRYSSKLFSSNNKIAFWGDYYANIIFYNFKTDSSKKLFDKDTYITSMNSNYGFYNQQKTRQISSKWVFYLVKNTDYNKSGRIDENDPALLYVTDIYGNGLKALTPDNENVISIQVFDKQNFALIKVQRDFDHNLDFKADDNDFYYVKLDLTNLTFGRKIEASSQESSKAN